MSDYYEDEYYEEPEWEISETSFESFLCKAPNGHLFVEEVVGWKYWGQDWGETVGQWEIYRYRIRELVDELQPIAIKIGRDLKPDARISCYLWDELEDDDWRGDLVEVDETYCMIEGEKEEGFSTHSDDDVSDLPF